MDYEKVSRYVVLGVLFFLPVTFLLMLYPATHNYTPLDIINESVADLQGFASTSEENVVLKDHITVLGFIGTNPMENATSASYLKELMYDKFKGFKRFQTVLVAPVGTEEAVSRLKTEISSYEDLRFWHFVFGDPSEIKQLFASLKSEEPLQQNLSTNHVFIIDKDLNQRGRIDDRADNELAKNI